MIRVLRDIVSLYIGALAACVHAAVRQHVRGAFSRPNRQYSRPDWMGRLDLSKEMWEYEYSYSVLDA